MTAKQYLKQARTLDMEINAKDRELHQLKLKSLCVQSVAISERVQSSGSNSGNKIIDKIVDLQIEINTEIDKLVDLKIEIHNKINAVDNPLHRTVLTEYYTNAATWEQVAEIINYSERQARRIHVWALQSFRKATKMG